MGLAETTQHLKRYKDIAGLIWKYGGSDIVKGIEAEDFVEEATLSGDAENLADDLPKDLENLGPTYVKFGQFLSTRADLLPQSYLDALQRLQNDVEPIPSDEVVRIFTEELGVRPEKAFVEFDREPLAAASLGQTHRAVMRNGRIVVVKIQRPGIRKQIADDLDAFEDMARLAEEKTEAGKRFMIHTTVKEFRSSMLRELDYRREAQNLLTMGKNLEEFENIIVPRPVESFTTDRVLTMEFIEGKKITSISPLRKLELDSEALADELLKAYLKQIVVDGFYHADPHPGNVFLTSLDEIALLDLGMVAWIPQEKRPDLLRLLMALSDGDGSKTTEFIERLGTKRHDYNEEGLSSAVTTFVMTHQDTQMQDLQTGRMVLGLTALASDNGITLPNEFVMIGKTLMNLDQVGLAISKNFNPSAAIRRHLAELMQRERAQDLSLSSIYGTFVETKEFAEELPGRANRILENLSNNSFSVKAEVFDEHYLMFGLQKIANRLTVGLVLAALIVGAALMMNVSTSWTLLGYPGIAIIFFLLAAMMGLILVWRIMFHDVEASKANRKQEQIM